MRERTTWNANKIKQAAMQRQADPYTMNQEHPQPKADAYVTGDPSSFAEDVSPNTWDVEYSNGQTKRDEIGMPEKRPETYTHAEKTAGMDEATLLKKASLCTSVARMMLRGRKFASGDALEVAVEDQAVALMHMPNADLVATANRLADEQEEAPQAQAPSQEASEQQMPEAQAPAQQSGMQQQGLEQQVAQLQQQVAQLLQQQGQGQVQASRKRANDQEQAPQAQQQQAQQQEQAPQAQQQQAQQQAPVQEPQVQQAQQQAPVQEPPMEQQADDMLLDEMLMGPDGGEMPVDLDSEMGIEMETPSMDVGEVVLAHEDEVLRTLFSNEETEQAEQAQGQQGQKQAGMARTASTRTVGTRPSGGVAKVGGAPAGRTGADVDKLAALWPSAPDVRDAFNMK